jgi:hypothetical protein
MGKESVMMTSSIATLDAFSLSNNIFILKVAVIESKYSLNWVRGVVIAVFLFRMGFILVLRVHEHPQTVSIRRRVGRRCHIYIRVVYCQSRVF